MKEVTVIYFAGTTIIHYQEINLYIKCNYFTQRELVHRSNILPKKEVPSQMYVIH